MNRINTALGVVCALGLSVLAPVPSFAADPVSIRADVNRDGTIDMASNSDEAGKGQATPERGALVLPNVDDDGKRCQAEAQQCNDATDQVVNGEADAADLAVVKTVPSKAGAGTISVNQPESRARLFIQRDNAWVYAGVKAELSAAQVAAGVTVGVEAADIVRDAKVWDGSIKVTFQAGGSSDAVALRVAPLLGQHHGQAAQNVVIAPNENLAKPTVFYTDLQQALTKAGLADSTLTVSATTDNWSQDWFESMYASVPRGSSSQQMRVLLLTDQARGQRDEVFALRGADRAVVDIRSKPTRDASADNVAGLQSTGFDAGGNIETLPPYQHAGKTYPAGRLILGAGPNGASSPGPSTTTMTLLGAQGIQSPLLVDSSWLLIGHVDEFMQVVPANNDRGWGIAVADPVGARALLEQLRSSGSGGVKVDSHPKGAATTIDQFLTGPLNKVQDTAAAAIEANVQRLLKETGLKASDVVRVPVLFEPMGAQGKLVAYSPNAVNSLVLNKRHVVTPRQFGPVVNGVDMLNQAVAQAYQKAGMTIVEADTHQNPHKYQGEVHCVTNALREMTPRWW